MMVFLQALQVTVRLICVGPESSQYASPPRRLAPVTAVMAAPRRYGVLACPGLGCGQAGRRFTDALPLLALELSGFGFGFYTARDPLESTRV